MAEITPEQLEAAETMPMAELEKLIFKTAQEAAGQKPDKAEQPRDDQGRFAKLQDTDELVIPENEQEQPAEGEDEEEAEPVFRKEIVNEDGTVDVYIGSSWDEVIDKIATAKREAVAQMKRVQAEKAKLSTKTAQEENDLDYVKNEEFKTNPAKVIRTEAERIAQKILDEREARNGRSLACQSKFVNTHPLYIGDPKSGNGDRLVKEFLRLYPEAQASDGWIEFTDEGLHKAYLSLEHDGLLVLKSQEASDATDGDAKETERTVQPEAKPTPQRSPKKSSNIRSNSIPVNPNQGPSEDELWTMPMDKLRDLANAQLKSRQK